MKQSFYRVSNQHSDISDILLRLPYPKDRLLNFFNSPKSLYPNTQIATIKISTEDSSTLYIEAKENVD